MKKNLLSIACIACVLSMFSSCVNMKDIMDSTNPEIKITIYGNVSDAETGESLSNVSVSAISLDGDGGTTAKSVTGNDGNYEMVVSTESFSNTIRAEKTKYETVELKIEMTGTWTKDQKYKADIQMHKEAVIYKGVVKDNKGYTLSGAKIDVSISTGTYSSQTLATAFTDEYGEYQVEVPRVIDEDNPKNNWANTIKVTKAGYISQTQKVSHTVSDLGKTYTINFELKEEIN